MVNMPEWIRGHTVDVVYIGSNPITHPKIREVEEWFYLACIGGRSMSVRIRSSRPGIDGESNYGRIVRISVVHTPCEVQTGL